MNKQVKRKAIRKAVQQGLAKRKARERRFRLLGLGAVVLGLTFLLIMFSSILYNGIGAFWQTEIRLVIDFDQDVIDPEGTRSIDALSSADYAGLVKKSMRDLFPEVTRRGEKRQLYVLASAGAAYQLREMVMENPDLIGTRKALWLPADDEVDIYVKHGGTQGRLSDKQAAWTERLIQDGKLEKSFNITFFTAADSREPELAGIKGAVMGSLFTILVTLGLSFPMGIAAAIYLEEFAPKNRWTDLIEVNINNLAAVPSIVFGLLGLAVFINFFGMPRSVPIVGGMVLTLMTLPTIIIAGRAALKSVPPSIKEAALGLGASQMQAVFHHVLPLAMPGMLTGSIIGMAQALGETAPLLLIGMVAFIVDIPGSAFDPSTVLPVQIYLWADSPERAFLERTAAAIMVLLVFLILMSLLAVWLRLKFEKRW